VTAHVFEALRTPLEAILALREDYRRSMNCQIVHDSWHARGFMDSYLLRVDGRVAGYGSVGGVPPDPKQTLKEFFVATEARAQARPLFRELLSASGAPWVEAQTNDVLLWAVFQDWAVDPTREMILFADDSTTALAPPGATIRRLTEADRANVFRHTGEPVGEWGLERNREIVATGGLLTHYNPPYADIHMEVAAPHRRQGLGAYLVQELKRLCYEMGRVPAARCRTDNVASRRTLERAGMLPCAHIVRGRFDQARNK
jgi:GNAT superfamily N-acetyltransferase